MGIHAACHRGDGLPRRFLSGVAIAAVDGAETRGHFLDQRRMANIACGGDDNPLGPIARFKKANDVFPAKARDGLLPAANRPADRMIPEEVEVKKIVDIIIRSVFRLRDFLENHGALALDLFGVETGMQENIAQQIDGQGQILVQHFGVVAGVLFGGKGVDNAAHGVHLFGDLRRAATLGALEKQMLDEVGDTILGRAFMTRAILDPDAETYRPIIRHVVRHDADAVV